MTERVFAIVIGTGFAGLAAAIALRKAGISDWVILEKANAIGGTWRENTYPGCACDVPSHLYSFSFAPNPRWRETFASQPELLAYLEQCADRYDLRRYVRFGTCVASAELDETAGVWVITTTAGDRFLANVVLSGMGPLHRWSLPPIASLTSFRGRVFHSAGWDHTFDPRGQRVATVGTGASAIQFIPALAKNVARLHVFQRTPAWVLPRDERSYSELEKQLFEHLPAAAWLHRQHIFWSHELRTVGFVQAPRILVYTERMAQKHLRRAIRDPLLRDKLTPRYRMGCKRILMSNTYYPALAQPNVEVIAGALERVTETGVIGPDGLERPVDAIVFGTGFDVHDYLGGLRIRGREGCDLAALWAREGAHAYFGINTPGFPNFFTLIGPNSGLGSNSIVFMLEAQVALVMRLVAHVVTRPGTLVDVRPEVERAFNERLQQQLRGTVWETGCQTWYHDAAGRNSTLWPGFCWQYWLATRRYDPADFRIETAGNAPPPASA